jgi:signal transduction histidine kinase
VDVAALLKNAVTAASPLLAARSLRIEAALGDLPAVAFLDPLFLRRILGCLLSAAAALTHEGAVAVTAERAGDELVLCVGGTGFQADDAETARGPGLRLSAARSLVRRLGGAVHLLRVEEAAYFRVSLPLAGSAGD